MSETELNTDDPTKTLVVSTKRFRTNTDTPKEPEPRKSYFQSLKNLVPKRKFLKAMAISLLEAALPKITAKALIWGSAVLITSLNSDTISKFFLGNEKDNSIVQKESFKSPIENNTTRINNGLNLKLEPFEYHLNDEYLNRPAYVSDLREINPEPNVAIPNLDTLIPDSIGSIEQVHYLTPPREIHSNYHVEQGINQAITGHSIQPRAIQPRAIQPKSIQQRAVAISSGHDGIKL